MLRVEDSSLRPTVMHAFHSGDVRDEFVALAEVKRRIVHKQEGETLIVTVLEDEGGCEGGEGGCEGGRRWL